MYSSDSNCKSVGNCGNGFKVFHVMVPLNDMVKFMDGWTPTFLEIEYWCVNSKQYLLIH